MSDKTETLQDVLNEIDDIDFSAQAEDSPGTEDTSEQSPGTDEAPQDTTGGTPAEKEESPGADNAGKPEDGSKPSEESPGGEGKDTESPPAEPEATIEIAGKRYTLTEAEKLLQSGERYTELQGEFTRRTQEQARQRQVAEDRDKLLEEMEAHEGIQDLVSRHPKVLRHLLSDPASTRALMGNAKELEAFVSDYELLSQSPSLAKRFAAGPQTPEARQQLEVEKTKNFMVYVGGSVDNAIDHVLKETGNKVPKLDVENYLRDLVGLDEKNTDPAASVRAFNRLHSLMFVPAQSGQGEEVDVTLLRKYVESRSAVNTSVNATKENKADAHNRRVDQALKASQEEKPPVLDGSSPGGNAPAKVDYKDLNDVLRDIEG